MCLPRRPRAHAELLISTPVLIMRRQRMANASFCPDWQASYMSSREREMGAESEGSWVQGVDLYAPYRGRRGAVDFGFGSSPLACAELLEVDTRSLER